MRMPNDSDAKEVKKYPIRLEGGMIDYGYGAVPALPHDRVDFDRRTSAQAAHDEWVRPGPAIVFAGGGTGNLPSLQQQHASAATDACKALELGKKNADQVYFGK